MDDHIEKHLRAARLDPDDIDDIHLANLRAAMSTVLKPDFMPLSAAIETYLEGTEGRVRASTLGAMRRDLTAFSKWLRADLEVASITRLNAGAYVSHLRKNGRAVKTNRDTVSVLSAFFGWCIRKGIYKDANPWSGQAVDLRDSSRGAASKDYSLLGQALL